MLQERTNQLLTAVDTLLRVHDEWESDATQPVHLTAVFESAIEEAIRVGDAGDIPANCRDLCTALQRLGIEWDKYVKGQRTADHRPIGAFWGAFRDVIHSREGAVPKEPKQPEPVFVLLEQKVTHNQIARYIWGHAGKGPFLNGLGQVDSGKIVEESKEPGKHTKGWIHPEQLERQRDSQNELARRLGATSRRELSDQRTVEKATVVELLKEGQYPGVIARVKGISLECVLDEAKRYSITPNIRPNLAATRGDKERPTIPTEQTQSSASTEDLPSPSNVSTDAEEDDDGEQTLEQDESPKMPVEDVIRSLNNGQRGTAEIVAAAKEAGYTVTHRQVKAALKVTKAS